MIGCIKPEDYAPIRGIKAIREYWQRMRAKCPRSMAAIDTVRREWVCPKCGENRMDWLAWRDDETVQCGTCGMKYQPGATDDSCIDDQCDYCGAVLAPGEDDGRLLGLCSRCARMAEEQDEQEFPVYVGTDGREHGEYW
jgi:phage FluMu protein Com